MTGFSDQFLKSALTRPELTVEVAIALVDYHARRDKVVKASHEETWLSIRKGSSSCCCRT
jgi:hypothetical protein